MFRVSAAFSAACASVSTTMETHRRVSFWILEVLPAKRFLAPNRSLQNSPPTTNENRFPAPTTAGLCCLCKTSSTPSPQARQNSSLPVVRSPLRKMDELAPSRLPDARSRSALVPIPISTFSENLFCILQSSPEKSSNFRSPSGYKHRTGRLQSPNVDR